MARRSTWVEPQGTHTSTLGLGLKKRVSCTLWMKCWSIFSVTVKSAMTPSFNGRMAVMLPGVRPSIIFASAPTACTERPPREVSSRIATTDGSLRTMPRPRA